MYWEQTHGDEESENSKCQADLRVQCRININHILPISHCFKEVSWEVWYMMHVNFSMAFAVTLLRGLVQ
jgi:hypothetical protein